MEGLITLDFSRMAAVCALVCAPQLSFADVAPSAIKWRCFYDDHRSAGQKAVFDAFNHCTRSYQKTLGGYFVRKDVEFYHDHDGLSVGGQAFPRCGAQECLRQSSPAFWCGSLKVYPLPNYSRALEIRRAPVRAHRSGRSQRAGAASSAWKNTGSGILAARYHA